MPELDGVCGYPAAICLMVAVVVGIVLWFSHRGWIGSNRQNPE